MITLGIETSCDETAAAVVKDGNVLSNEVSSSVHLHSGYGGVVPEIASRFHTEYIYSVTEKALSDASVKVSDIDLISVTRGPGLPGSLLVGMAFAKALSFAGNIPLIGVNHLYAHIRSAFLGRMTGEGIKKQFPFLGAVVSGGHTSLYRCEDFDDIPVIGRTKDDAVGEAFDKVAKILDLGYPGGPVVEKMARSFSGENVIPFPRPLLKKNDGLDFSFSGIKTAVMYHWKGSCATEEEKERICFSFQEAVVDTINAKICRALDETGLKKVAVGGGVVNNKALRHRLISSCKKMGAEVFIPEEGYCADNAAMIAALGEDLFKKGESSTLFMKAEPCGF